MNKSENFNFNLPSSDNPEELADVNFLSENFINADKILKKQEEEILNTKNVVSNDVANALKGSKSGNPVVLDDISPLPHEIKVNATRSNYEDVFLFDVEAQILIEHDLPYSNQEMVVSSVFVDLDEGFVKIAFEDDYVISFQTSDKELGNKVNSLKNGDIVYIENIAPDLDNGIYPQTNLYHRIKKEAESNEPVNVTVQEGNKEPKTFSTDENGNVKGIIGKGESIILSADEVVSISVEYNRDINKASGSGGNGADGSDGEDGATFIPDVSPDGLLSWTNNKGLENPDPVNIKGEKGEQGEKGDTGRKKLNKNINFVGMSIWWNDQRTLAEGFGGGVTAKGYQTLLKEYFEFLSTKNYCYSGFSLGATSETDASSIMASKANSWTGTDGDVWTLDTITNDFKRNIPIGTIDDYTNATGVLTYYGALRAFVDKVAELSGNNAVVICSNALRRNNSGYTSTSQNTQGHTLLDYEFALMNVAVRNSWYFVDQYRLSGITDETITLTTLDGLHLNNFGYTLAVKPWIEQIDIICNKLMATEEHPEFNPDVTGTTTNGYVNNSGAFVGATNWVRTDYIPVNAGENYLYTGATFAAGTTGTSYAVYGYDDSKNPVTYLMTEVDGTNGLLFTIPEGVFYIACCSLANVEEFKIKAVTDESGWYELGSDTINHYLKADGTTSPSGNWRTSDFVAVNADGRYMYYGNTSPNASAVCVLGYDASKNVVSILLENGSYIDGSEFSVPNGVYFIRYCSTAKGVASVETLGVWLYL